ncbi:MAG: hypothetical protein MHM6MM_006786, partial [Cercozoa sp. M6MM]
CVCCVCVCTTSFLVVVTAVTAVPVVTPPAPANEFSTDNQDAPSATPRRNEVDLAIHKRSLRKWMRIISSLSYSHFRLARGEQVVNYSSIARAILYATRVPSGVDKQEWKNMQEYFKDMRVSSLSKTLRRWKDKEARPRLCALAFLGPQANKIQ